MKPIHTFFAALILVFVATSCEETFTSTIEVDQSHLEAKGVIFGLLSNSDPRDSVFQERNFNRDADAPSPENRIFLSNTSTKFRNGNEFYKAKVELNSEKGKLPLRYYELDHKKEPFYSVMEALKPGEVYHIAAQCDSSSSQSLNWAAVTAKDTMPMPVDLQVIDAGIQYSNLTGTKSKGYIDIKIKDEPFKRNMYQAEVSIIQSQSLENDQSLDIIIPAAIDGTEDRVSSEVFGTYHLNLIHEAEFSRQGEKRISFTFHTNDAFFNKERPVTLMIRFSNLSSNYVEFLKSSRQYFAMGDNPFAEPAEVYSNVHNGYGIFACSARSFASVVVE